MWKENFGRTPAEGAARTVAAAARNAGLVAAADSPSAILAAKLVDAAMAHHQWLTGQEPVRRTGKLKPLRA